MVRSAFSSYKFKSMLLYHLLAAFLVISVFCSPVYSFIWKALDEGVVRLLNQSVLDRPWAQNFWAVANHRIGDYIEDLFFIVFLVWLIKVTPRGEKIRKGAEFFFVALLTTAIVLFINNLLFKQLIHIRRLSPSLVLDSLPRLADQVSWIKVKSTSKVSFPSDHATTAVMFIANFIYLSRNTVLTFSACLYGLFLCCPRIVAGAHWPTDALCGSAAVVIVVYSWAFCTPFASVCIRKIEQVFVWIHLLFKKKEKKHIRL